MSSELKPGYKYTDLGIIPESWEVCDLKTLRLDISDGNYSSKYPKASDFKNIGIPFIRANNISALTVLDLDMRFISKEQHQDLLKGHLKKNDLLITTRGEIGQIAFVPDRHIGSNINAQIVRINTAGSPLAHKFLGYYLLSGRAQEQIQNLQTGSALKQLPVGRLLQVKVAIPPADIQEKIAESLYAIDTLINSFDQLIAKKRDIQQATMQQLLTGQRRLPGFSGEWEVRCIEEIADCLDNLRVPLNESQRNDMKGDYPYCGANGVLDYVNSYVIDDDIILMAEDGGYFDEYRFRPIAYRMTGKCWVNNHAHILKSKSGYDQGFLFYSLVHKNILSYLASGTRAKLNKSEMNKIEIHLPKEKTEQTAIATILADMDAELATLETRYEKACQLKQGMMQELLTGRIRLA